jgi:hypothetical protein
VLVVGRAKKICLLILLICLYYFVLIPDVDLTNTLLGEDNQILIHEIVNASGHLHPWMATFASIAFLIFIMALIFILSSGNGPLSGN